MSDMPTLMSEIQHRARRTFPSLREVFHTERPDFQVLLAGGCLALPDTPNDVDVFPWSTPAGHCAPRGGLVPVTTSANAKTYETSQYPVQWCNGHPCEGESNEKESDRIRRFVNTFDFAHCQVGALVCGSLTGGLVVSCVAWTPAFVDAQAARTTWYTSPQRHRQYPLASLLRASKYYKRDLLPYPKLIAAMFKTITELVTAGFKDYEDFKDQLDAVDLGLTPEELDEVSQAELMSLFELLRKDK